jgi:hypothetical protein
MEAAGIESCRLPPITEPDRPQDDLPAVGEPRADGHLARGIHRPLD